jgi:hypothetical protein
VSHLIYCIFKYVNLPFVKLRQIIEYQIELSIRQLVDYDCRQKTSLNDHLVKIPNIQYAHSELK